MKKEQTDSRFAEKTGGEIRNLPYDAMVHLLRFGFSKLQYIFIGILFARVRFFVSVAPLAVSLAAASGENLPYFALGSLLYTLTNRDVAGAGGILTVLVLRLTFLWLHTRRQPRFDGKESLFGKEELQKLWRQSLTLRLSAAAVGGFAVGAIRTVYGGFGFGDLFGLLLYVGLCLIFTYIFSAARESQNPMLKKACSAVFYILCVYALSPFSLFGFSFSYLLAAFFAFTAAKTERPAVSAALGAALLLPLSPVYAAALAAASLCAAVLYPRSTLYAVCGGSIAFALLSFLLGGSRVFAAAFPEVLLGAVISAYLITKKKTTPKTAAAASAAKGAVNEVVLEEAAAGEKKSLLDLADSFEQMANTFFSLSDRAARTEQLDTRAVCARAFDRLCRRCPAAKVCFGRAESRAADAQRKLSSRLAASGQVSAADLPEEFAAFCPHTGEILEEIEFAYADVLERRLKDYGQFSAYASALSSLIRHALLENERAYTQNANARRAAEKALAEIGFSADALGVYGERQKTVYAFHLSPAAMNCNAQDIKAALGAALDAPVEDPTFEFADGGIRMSCKTLPRFEVTSDMTSTAWDFCEENGDSVRIFEGKEGYTYALISDGMGRGHLAAEKSRRAALFLEKMLTAGNSVRTSIELLSILLRSEDTEGFTTVDLLEIDRHLGKVCFFKSGAAPSFVRRGVRIFKIRSRTFPIGILEDVDAEKNTFSAMDGDIIVMVSDGIVGEYDEPLWLCNLLARSDFAAHGTAAEIRRAAEAHAMGADDRSVCVLRIRARAGETEIEKDKEEEEDKDKDKEETASVK